MLPACHPTYLLQIHVDEDWKIAVHTAALRLKDFCAQFAIMPPATVALDNPFLVSRLCEKCTSISENWAELLDTNASGELGMISAQKSFMHHYSTLSNLESSAKLGCALCIHLLQSMDGQDARNDLDDLYENEDGRMRMVRLGKHGFILDIDVRNDQTNIQANDYPIDNPLHYTVNRDHSQQPGIINLQVVIMPISASLSPFSPSTDCPTDECQQISQNP